MASVARHRYHYRRYISINSLCDSYELKRSVMRDKHNGAPSVMHVGLLSSFDTFRTSLYVFVIDPV